MFSSRILVVKPNVDGPLLNRGLENQFGVPLKQLHVDLGNKMIDIGDRIEVY